MANISFRFTKSKIEEIKKLNEEEFYIFYSLILIIHNDKGDTYVNEIIDRIGAYPKSILSTIHKTSIAGLLKRTKDGILSFGDYDLKSKPVYEMDVQYFIRLGRDLTPSELFVYFTLLLESDSGIIVLKSEEAYELMKGMKKEFLKSRVSKLNEVEESLTAKGYLAPVMDRSYKTFYTLFDGKGQIANCNF